MIYILCLVKVLFSAVMFCSARFGIAVLAFMGFFITNAQRTSIGVAVVCMANQTFLEESQMDKNSTAKTEFDGTCGHSDDGNTSVENNLNDIVRSNIFGAYSHSVQCLSYTPS